MLKAAAAVALVLTAIAAPVEAGVAADPAPRSCTPPEQCCKVCDAGKACGKTCISAKKTCHVGKGCACDRSELCPVR